MFDMQALKFIEQRSIATEFGFIEVPIILFGGGTKRGQQKDIDRAKALHAEYKARKKSKAATTHKVKRKR